MLTLSADELARLRVDLYDLITDRVADLVSTDDPQTWLAAMLTVDAGLAAVAPEVTRELRARARAAGMTYERIAAARGTRKQSEHRAVSGG